MPNLNMQVCIKYNLKVLVTKSTPPKLAISYHPWSNPRQQLDASWYPSSAKLLVIAYL
jgi:hypothetical protein